MGRSPKAASAFPSSQRSFSIVTRSTSCCARYASTSSASVRDLASRRSRRSRSSSRSRASEASRSEANPPRCTRFESRPPTRYRYAHVDSPSRPVPFSRISWPCCDITNHPFRSEVPGDRDVIRTATPALALGTFGNSKPGGALRDQAARHPREVGRLPHPRRACVRRLLAPGGGSNTAQRVAPARPKTRAARLVRPGEGLRVAPGRHSDSSLLSGSGVVEVSLVDPARAFVERAGSCVARDDREPRLRVAVRSDLALRLADQDLRDAGSAKGSGDIHLLYLIADDHHESDDGSLDRRHGCVRDTFRRPRSELRLGPASRSCCGTNPRWPSCQPRCQISAMAPASSARAGRSISWARSGPGPLAW